MTPAEAEIAAQQSNLRFSDINSDSPTLTGAREAGAQDASTMQMQMMQSNMTMFMQMLAKQQADLQKQMMEMEIRQRRELATMLQNQQTAQSSNASAGHPLAGRGLSRSSPSNVG
jgi:hypothetical protein